MSTELGLREIREAIGNNLQLPQLLALAGVAKDFRTTYRAWLPAPSDLERLWALGDPFAVRSEGTTLMTEALKNFELTTSELCRARAQTLRWAPCAALTARWLKSDWSSIARIYPDLRRLVQCLRPRLFRGFEASDFNGGAGEFYRDEGSGGDITKVLYNIATVSVDGAPGVVLHLDFAYLYGEDEFDTGEEIWTRLSFSVDGGAPRELCRSHPASLTAHIWMGRPSMWRTRLSSTPITGNTRRARP